MSRELKNLLYEQVARFGRALSSPKRLELLELLAQGEKTVEVLAQQAAIDIKLASAHLRVLRQERLVETRKDGRHVLYRVAGEGVSALLVALREEAEERLVELQVALAELVEHPGEAEGLSGAALLRKAKDGDVVVLDVRPVDEYASGHLPHARSMPLEELSKQVARLPRRTPVVAYCRGPFCLLARDAVRLLRSKGLVAYHLSDGVAEWRARGLPVEA